MKTWVSPTWILGLALVMAPAPGGLAQNGLPLETNPAGDISAATALAKIASEPDRVFTNAATATPLFSPWTSEIVKLAQAGIDDGVMLSFIENSGTFNLGAEQIIYLRDLGVPGEIIAAMLQHDAELAAGLRPLTILTAPAPQAAFWITVAPSAAASAKASTPPPTTPAASASAHNALATIPSGTLPTQQATLNSESMFKKSLRAPSGPFGVPRLRGLGSLPPEGGTPNLTSQTGSEPSPLEYAMPDELGSGRSSAPGQPRQAPEEKGKLYPVREPHPVELTPPIIFIQAAGRAANTVVIQLFP